MEMSNVTLEWGERVINVNQHRVKTGWRQAIFHSGIFIDKAMNGNEIFEVRA